MEKNTERIIIHTGPARRQRQHTDCVYSHHTDNNKIILAHFIINRTILIERDSKRWTQFRKSVFQN